MEAQPVEAPLPCIWPALFFGRCRPGEYEMKTIAIVDDDVYIGDMLAELLQKQGYGVLRAYSGTEALYLLERQTPDLVLLDLMLPGLSGQEVLPRLQGVPVIVVSARADIQDKVGLLLGGAADYITKPFDMRELLARVEVQLRRQGAALPAAAILQAGELALDTASRQASIRGSAVKLTRTEYAILKLLMQNPQQVLTKSVLLDRIGAETPDCTESSLKIHVSNLRKKLRQLDGQNHIESVWGIGFKLAES